MAAVMTRARCNTRRFAIAGMVYTPGIGWHDPQSHNQHRSIVFYGDAGKRLGHTLPMPRNVGVNPAFVRLPRS